MKFDKYIVKKNTVTIESNYVYNPFLAEKLQEEGYVIEDVKGYMKITVYYGEETKLLKKDILKFFTTLKAAIEDLDTIEDKIDSIIANNWDIYKLNYSLNNLTGGVEQLWKEIVALTKICEDLQNKIKLLEENK